MAENFEVILMLRVKTELKLNDPETTERTIRFLVEKDLRDKGLDVNVEII